VTMRTGSGDQLESKPDANAEEWLMSTKIAASARTPSRQGKSSRESSLWAKPLVVSGIPVLDS